MVRNFKLVRYVIIAAIVILAIVKLGSSDSQKANVSALRDYSKSLVLDRTANSILSGGTHRENATFVTLSRNQDLWGLVGSIREVEDRFNHKFNYDWVFLNDAEFSEEFKTVTSSFVSGNTYYGRIPKAQWSIPDYVDEDKAIQCRKKMEQDGIIYGGSESYRHMCRYESGFFWRHPLLDNYKYYWRVEPHVKLMCNIPEDPFKFMRENNKRYGFTISLYEYQATIMTLWDTVKGFMKEYPQYLNDNNALKFISDDGGENYNLCHFWSNFEIGDLDFWRGEAYQTFFDYLDRAGGFFYERWGDAPVHSIAAAILLDKEQIHWFEDIGYWHVPFMNCPVNKETRNKLQCTCPKDESLNDDQRHNFAFHGYSCTGRWLKFNNIPFPVGYDKDN